MAQEFQTIRDQIINKLNQDLTPVSLEVVDDSHKHIGHAGHNGKGESHFRVHVVSSAFEGKSRVVRHQMVYEILKDLIPPIHALQIKADNP